MVKGGLKTDGEHRRGKMADWPQPGLGLAALKEGHGLRENFPSFGSLAPWTWMLLTKYRQEQDIDSSLSVALLERKPSFVLSGNESQPPWHPS